MVVAGCREEGAGCAEALGTEFVHGVFGLREGAALTEFCGDVRQGNDGASVERGG